MMPPKIVMAIRTDWVSNVLKVTQTDDKKKKKDAESGMPGGRDLQRNLRF